MSQQFEPGDFLVFQLESGYGLARVLDVTTGDQGTIWHIALYRDLFLDVEMAEAATKLEGSLQIEIPHVALTDRAFESTQVSRIANAPLKPNELSAVGTWNGELADRSIRLILGLR